MGCCPPRGYDRVFDERQARRDLRRYRRRGLAQDARRAVAFLRGRGTTVLEVGGGIGSAQVELLRGGAERVVNVELSPGYEEAARELAAAEGVAGRIDRRLGDVCADAESVEPADAVLLVRVVCCYPDYETLLSVAAGRARRALVYTHPRGGPLARAAAAAGNLVLRLARNDFRAYAHDPAAMDAVVERHGLRLAHRSGGLVWRVAAFERP